MSSEPNQPSVVSRLAPLFGFTERFLIAAVYLYLAWRQLGWVRVDIANVDSRGASALSYLSYDVIITVLNLIMSIVLLAGRSATVAPSRLRDIIVPLAASFYFFLYNYVDDIRTGSGNVSPWLWALVRQRGPAALHESFAITSFAIGAIGILLSTWGILMLGRSFGIFVAVRSVVPTGPYAYLRHPMYSGYIISSVGLMFADLSVAILILVPVQIALFAWRAKLEEGRLAAFSEDYRALQSRTGFFYPRAGTPAFWWLSATLVAAAVVPSAFIFAK